MDDCTLLPLTWLKALRQLHPRRLGTTIGRAIKCRAQVVAGALRAANEDEIKRAVRSGVANVWTLPALTESTINIPFLSILP